jgi:hypothetical protein
MFATVAGFAIVFWVLFLYRRKRLKEDYAILWISVSASIILLSNWTDLLLGINWFVGAASVSDVVLAAFVAFLLITSIYYSVRLSELSEQNKMLAQEIALIRTASEVKTDKPNYKHPD